VALASLRFSNSRKRGIIYFIFCLFGLRTFKKGGFMAKIEIYTDGAGWNGKVSKYAYLILKDGKEIKREVEVVNKKLTNNEAEYTALIEALKDKNSKNATIYMDSKLVVEQLAGNYVVKAENLYNLFLKAQELVKKRNVKLKWIPRKKNIAGKII